MENNLSVRKYLERINYTGSLDATAENLALLQKAHLMSVPYENLDLYCGRETTLSIEDIYNKVVNQRRGGYCFELNGIFGWLLRQLGYRTEEYFGRWLMGEPLTVPMRRHRVIKVFTDKGCYLGDVGVGRRSPLTPLKFADDEPQMREGANYRMVNDPVLYKVVQIERPEGYVSMFSFDEAPQENIDFTYPHYYCAHHPASPFLSKMMIHLPTVYGRNSVSDAVDPQTGAKTVEFAIDRQDGTTYKFLIHSNEQLREGLAQYFGIKTDFPVQIH